jgi:hypothetical protein
MSNLRYATEHTFESILGPSGRSGNKLLLSWPKLGFGNVFFHMMTLIHEAAVYGEQYIVCEDDHAWEYPWTITDIFVMEYQSGLPKCSSVRRLTKSAGGMSSRGHVMAFWDKEYMYKITTDFYYWKYLIQRHFRPCAAVFNQTRQFIGLPSANLTDNEHGAYDRTLTFRESFRKWILTDLFPDSDSWPRPWIALHVRAADSLEDRNRPYVGVKTLADLIAVLPPSITGGTVLLASDSKAVLSGFGNSSAWLVKTMPVDRSIYTATYGLIELRMDLDRSEVLMDLILDIGFLTQADVFVLPLYGSFARMIAALSKPEAVVISSDGAEFCPFAGCDMGRTDPKFCANGGFTGSYIKEFFPTKVNISHPEGCHTLTTGFNGFIIPANIRPLWETACLLRMQDGVTCDSCKNASVLYSALVNVSTSDLCHTFVNGVVDPSVGDSDMPLWRTACLLRMRADVASIESMDPTGRYPFGYYPFKEHAQRTRIYAALPGRRGGRVQDAMLSSSYEPFGPEYWVCLMVCFIIICFLARSKCGYWSI